MTQTQPRIVRYQVTLDDGRRVSLFVNRDTRLVVLDVINANESDLWDYAGGCEILRRVV